MGSRGSTDAHSGPHSFTVVKRTWDEHKIEQRYAGQGKLYERKCAEVQCSVGDCSETDTICGDWHPA